MVGWCTVPWSRSLSKMAMLRQFFHIPRNFEFCHDRLFWGTDDVSTLTLKGFQVSDTNSLGWCIVTRSRAFFKMAMLGKSLHHYSESRMSQHTGLWNHWQCDLFVQQLAQANKILCYNEWMLCFWAWLGLPTPVLEHLIQYFLITITKYYML